jgi:hypothetical protein
MSKTVFALDGLDTFRVEFVVKDGQVVELAGHYDNGTSDASPRTK